MYWGIKEHEINQNIYHDKVEKKFWRSDFLFKLNSISKFVFINISI